MKNRNHPISIIYFQLSLSQLLQNGAYLIPIILASNKISEASKYQNKIVIGVVIILGLLLVIVIFKYIAWYKTFYIIDDDAVKLSKFTKLKTKNVVILRDKISSINSSQTLLLRMFKVCKASITTDTSVGNDKDSIDLIVSEEMYLNIKEELKKGSVTVENRSENDYEKHYPLTRLLLYFALDSPLIITLAIVMVGVEFIFSENDIFTKVLIASTFLIYIFNKMGSTANLEVSVNDHKQEVEVSTKLLSKTNMKFTINKIKELEIINFKFFSKYLIYAGVVGSLEKNKGETIRPCLSLVVNKLEKDEIVSKLGYDINNAQKFRPSKYHILLTVVPLTLLVIALFIIAFYSLPLDKLVVQIILPILIVLAIFTFILKIVSYLKTQYLLLTDDYIVVSKGYYKNIVRIYKYEDFEYAKFNAGIISRALDVRNIELYFFRHSKATSHVRILNSYSLSDCEQILKIIENKTK